MRLLKGIIISSVMIGILLGFSLESSAVPNLQIYIPGATYDYVTDTWVINSYEYELWVTGANVTIEDVRFAAAVPLNEVGSIEVTWSYSDDPNDPLDQTLIFSHSNTDPYVRVGEEYDYDEYLAKINVTDSGNELDPTIYGYAENDTPVFGDGVTTIPTHDVFPTDFYEYYIGDFNEQDFDNTAYNYDPAEYDPDEGFLDTAPGMTKKFSIKVYGYTWVDLVAYDHYLGNNKVKYVKTPFSHDGASAIPEPATMFLLGTGLIGLGAFGRRKFFKKL
jgi:hypothetical protein